MLQIIDRTAEDEEESEIEELDYVPDTQEEDGSRTLFSVEIGPLESFNKDDYRIPEGENRVLKVLNEEMDEEGLRYKIRFGDTRHEEVSLNASVLAQFGVILALLWPRYCINRVSRRQGCSSDLVMLLIPFPI